MKKINLQIPLTIKLLAVSFLFASAQSYTYSDPQPAVETGTALFYADYLHGQSTAMGEIYNRNEFTCSHRYHPKGTLLKVTRLNTGKSVTVRVNDRGTFTGDAVILLSQAAAMDLDLIKVGKAEVTIELVGATNSKIAFTDRTTLANKGEGFDKSPSNYNTSTEQLIPKGGNSAGFKWNTTPKGGATTNTNSVPSNYNVAPSNLPVSSGYGIQLGSYGVFDNANRQLTTLQSAGVTNTFVKESLTVSGGKLFRVMVGSFTSRTDAQTYLQTIRTQHLVDGIVVDLSK